MIADMPCSERPRERLISKGSDALSDTELIAIVLGSGTRGKNVLELSQELLIRFQTLQNLLGASLEKLQSVKGIGAAKAIQLKALFELASRAYQPAFQFRYPLFAPEDAYRFVREKFYAQKNELMVCILRDNRGAAFDCQVLAKGQLNAVFLQPRDVFHTVLQSDAKSFILCHNHPSGDPTPSSEDISMTRALGRMGKDLGLRLDDHLILGKSSFQSLYHSGFVETRPRY